MTATQQLVELAMSADPFRNAPPHLAELQLEAVRERFADRRQQIRTLDKRARETGVAEVRTLADVVPLLFAHTNYKSYPEAFIDSGQWKHMNQWLRTLSAYPTEGIDVADVRDVDDWLGRAHAAGHFVFASSGTTGKSSFLNQTATDREYAVAACLHAFTFSSPENVPDHSRCVFTQMPSKGTHKMIEVATAQFERWAKPNELHRARCSLRRWPPTRPRLRRARRAAPPLSKAGSMRSTPSGTSRSIWGSCGEPPGLSWSGCVPEASRTAIFIPRRSCPSAAAPRERSYRPITSSRSRLFSGLRPSESPPPMRWWR
jgi:hypothetical protein